MRARHSRRFILQRNEDATGISGTGAVAEGCEFTSGLCAMTWLSEHRTMEWYESIKTVIELHGHEGRTEVVWLDEEEKPKRKKKNVGIPETS